MPYQTLLDEVQHLNGVSARLELLADQHPNVTEELMTISGNVRGIGTLLALLVATRLRADPPSQ